MDEQGHLRTIPVTKRNLWFLERSIPLFGMLDFFPKDVIGPPAFKQSAAGSRSTKSLTIETDQGWSFKTDIASDRQIFRNCARSRGSGKWVKQAGLKPGDHIVLERLDNYTYRLSRQSGDE